MNTQTDYSLLPWQMNNPMIPAGIKDNYDFNRRLKEHQLTTLKTMPIDIPYDASGSRAGPVRAVVNAILGPQPPQQPLPQQQPPRAQEKEVKKEENGEEKEEEEEDPILQEEEKRLAILQEKRLAKKKNKQNNKDRMAELQEELNELNDEAAGHSPAKEIIRNLKNKSRGSGAVGGHSPAKEIIIRKNKSRGRGAVGGARPFKRMGLSEENTPVKPARAANTNGAKNTPVKQQVASPAQTRAAAAHKSTETRQAVAAAAVQQPQVTTRPAGNKPKHCDWVNNTGWVVNEKFTRDNVQYEQGDVYKTKQEK